MDIIIEVVNEKEELKFPYVAEYDEGVKALIIGRLKENYLIGWTLESNERGTITGFCYDDFKESKITKRYKILEANYKLKEV